MAGLILTIAKDGIGREIVQIQIFQRPCVFYEYDRRQGYCMGYNDCNKLLYVNTRSTHIQYRPYALGGAIVLTPPT